MLKNEARRPFSKASDWELPKISYLRLWMILLILALPFFNLSVPYFEALERTGTIGAIIADTTFSALLVCYVVLLCILKQRRI